MIGPLAPLVRASTRRLGVLLLLGGVIALPYALLAAAFAQTPTADDLPRGAVLVLLAIALVVAVRPAFDGAVDGPRRADPGLGVRWRGRRGRDGAGPGLAFDGAVDGAVTGGAPVWPSMARSTGP
jgi:hypothetical protein